MFFESLTSELFFFGQKGIEEVNELWLTCFFTKDFLKTKIGIGVNVFCLYFAIFYR